MDTHDITTKPSPQLMVRRHGALFRLLPHYHPNEKAECLCGWMESRGGSGMVGRTINPLCGPSEFWSLRCCTVPVLLASSTATVTLTNCLPSWVNVLLRTAGSPFLHHATASTTAAFAVTAEGNELRRGGDVSETECLLGTVEEKLFVGFEQERN